MRRPRKSESARYDEAGHNHSPASTVFSSSMLRAASNGDPMHIPENRSTNAGHHDNQNSSADRSSVSMTGRPESNYGVVRPASFRPKSPGLFPTEDSYVQQSHHQHESPLDYRKRARFQEQHDTARVGGQSNIGMSYNPNHMSPSHEQAHLSVASSSTAAQQPSSSTHPQGLHDSSQYTHPPTQMHSSHTSKGAKRLHHINGNISSDSDDDISECSMGELHAFLKKENYRLSNLTEKIRRVSRKITRLSHLIEERSQSIPLSAPHITDLTHTHSSSSLASRESSPVQVPILPRVLTPAPVPVSIPQHPTNIKSNRTNTIHLERQANAQYSSERSREVEEVIINSSDTSSRPYAMVRNASDSHSSVERTSSMQGNLPTRFSSVNSASPLGYEPIPSHSISSPRRISRPDADVIEIRPPTNRASNSSAPNSGPWLIKTRPKIESMYGIIPQTLGKFERKPRTLLLPPDTSGALSEIAVTSSLSGSLQWWNLKTRRTLNIVDEGIMRNGWTEDMCWIGPNILAIAAGPPPQSSRHDGRVQHQVALMYNCHITKRSMYELGTLDFRLEHLKEMPHDRNISAISPMTPINTKTRWLTASSDKRLFLWSFENQFHSKHHHYNPISHRCLHEIHTSTIHSVYHNPFSEIVYSGGADSRLVGWSLESGENTLSSTRQFAAIRDVIGIPNQPNMLLVGFMDKSSHMKALDLRTNEYVLNLSIPDDVGKTLNVQVDSMGNEREKLSQTKYMHASVHPSGYTVSLGHSSSSDLNIWDLRYVEVNSPTQTFNLHSNRVLYAKFFEGFGRSSLVSISTDNTFMVSDYKR
ncbi:hypothetical protein BASA61_001554 [Batrachochytrium salamandrivorans]|nr:hypothetical protein BASA61_001554 [Batrachochytrium salamandrivorans]KAH9251215.1 hypothetical protein BASA81_010910 [Batrachochytrium salamandrivorans]